MTEPKCQTSCRDEIFAKIDGMLPKSIVWKGILFIFMLWGVANGLYAIGFSERTETIKSNRVASTENTKSIAVISKDMEYIKEALKSTNDKLDIILTETRIENKKRRHNE